MGPRQSDTTAPTVTTAQTSAIGGQIQLRFSENLKTSNLPPTSAFEVTTDGEPHATSSSVSVGTDLVFFTVSPSISQGQAVVVTYTDPTSANDANAIQDAAGNDVETFTTGMNSVPGVTNLSSTAATAPNAPTGLTATASGSSQIDLSWTAPADNGGRVITGYKIEVSSDGGNAWTDHVATTGDNNTTYAHTGLSASTTRHYRVSAINSIGTSSASNVDNATTGTNDPPTAMNGAVTMNEDKIFYFRLRPDLLGYSDPDRNGMGSFTVTEMPARGALTMSGWQINNLPFRIYSDTTENRGRSLQYRPPKHANGTPYATFKFKVNDGRVDSAAEYTMTINVTPVNDPAYGRVFINGPSQAGYDLTAFTSSMGDYDGIPRDQLDYQWKRYAANGTTFETNIGANSSTYTVTDNDVGKKIKLEVSYVDGGGTREVRLSDAFPYIATQTIGDATFISTIGMAGDSFHTFAAQNQGQVFTTGGHPNGYTVTSVVIISEDSAGDDVALKICEVDENLHPTAVCTDLTAPGSSPAGPLVFTAPSGTTLTGGRTNYMVVFDSPGGEHVQLDAHKSDGYDSNSLAGFSIRNRIHYKTGTGWQETSYRRGLRIAVLGTINP